MPISGRAPLVLGSASPRRREILESLGIPIRVLSGAVDEARRPAERAPDYLERVVTEKLADVVRRLSAGLAPGESVAAVLVADTIVVLDGEILGKPADRAEARELVGRIAGRSHVVWTRYALAAPPDLAAPRIERTVESVVTMRSASPEEIALYAATGEGLDKAGAYAAQGIGAFLIRRIEGSFSNVIGLPACEVVEDLARLGLLSRFPSPVA